MREEAARMHLVVGGANFTGILVCAWVGRSGGAESCCVRRSTSAFVHMMSSLEVRVRNEVEKAAAELGGSNPLPEHDLKPWEDAVMRALVLWIKVEGVVLVGSGALWRPVSENGDYVPLCPLDELGLAAHDDPVFCAHFPVAATVIGATPGGWGCIAVELELIPIVSVDAFFAFQAGTVVDDVTGETWTYIIDYARDDCGNVIAFHAQ